MNLVQIQERLKDAPTQAIMQYANGGNPMVPPYLALAELKRRESINKSAQAQQAMQQGQPPSVKDQIEQAAGLAALQQQMQQQGLQGLMQQARPQGIPENVPQPTRQPESEGIAGLPAGDFNFADGGIVAFQGGGETEIKSNEQLRKEYEQARASGDFQEASRIFRLIKMRESEAPRTVKVAPAMMGEEVAPSRTPAAPAMPSAMPEGAPPAERRAGALPHPGGIAGQIALPSRGAGAMPMGAPEADGGAAPQSPSTPRAGIAALPGASEAGEMMLGAMRAKTPIEDIHAQQQKTAGLYGLKQPYGEERMKRIQAMEASRQPELESRGMERLMRVLGGIGARGLAGASPAYLQAIGEERAADAAFRKQMDELMGGVEDKRRAEAMAQMTAGTARQAKEKEAEIGAAEKIYDAETKFKLQELQQKAVLGRLSPEEEYIRREIAKGRLYPEIKEELAKAAGASREDVSAEGRRRQYIEQWNKLLSDPLAKEEYRKLGIDTLEKYLRYVGAGDGTSSIPPIPAGAVRLKGAQ